MQSVAMFVRLAGLLALAAMPRSTGEFVGDGKAVEIDLNEDSVSIVFEGTILSHTFFPQKCCEGMDADLKGCKPTGVSFGPYTKTSLAVGANPQLVDSWFFRLQHYASDTDAIFGFTKDRVLNLDFASSVLACWELDGQPCGYLYYPYNLVLEKTLDLDKAIVNKTEVNGAPGYQVKGDAGTFTKTSNRTYEPSVDVDADCFYSGSAPDTATRDIEWMGYAWTPDSNFSYSLSFSDKTASMSITTYANGSRMELEFSGTRKNNESAPIQLITSNSTMPMFEYINGTELFVTTSSAETTTPTATPTRNEQPTSASSSSSSAEAVYAYEATSQSVIWSMILGSLLALLG